MFLLYFIFDLDTCKIGLKVEIKITSFLFINLFKSLALISLIFFGKYCLVFLGLGYILKFKSDIPAIELRK